MEAELSNQHQKRSYLVVEGSTRTCVVVYRRKRGAKDVNLRDAEEGEIRIAEDYIYLISTDVRSRIIGFEEEDDHGDHDGCCNSMAGLSTTGDSRTSKY